MDKAEAIARLLRSAPRDSRCPVCVAFAVSVSLDESRAILQRLVVDAGDITRLAGRCAGCGRETEVYGVTAGRGRPKCSRCSAVIDEQEQVVQAHGELFHARCWQVLTSADAVRESHERTRRARDRIAESRKRLESGQTNPPEAE